MKLSSLKFVIKDTREISEEEKDILVNAYKNLFIKTYGTDVVDAYSYVTKINTSDLIKKCEEVKYLAQNHKRAIQTIREVEEDANSKSLLIYYDSNLVGIARLMRINDEVCNVPQIALTNLDKEIEREIWKLTLSYIIQVFTKEGYKRMYLEIPLKEGPLLLRAYELGFKENPEDIIETERVYTYVLNKTLEGINNE